MRLLRQLPVGVVGATWPLRLRGVAVGVMRQLPRLLPAGGVDVTRRLPVGAVAGRTRRLPWLRRVVAGAVAPPLRPLGVIAVAGATRPSTRPGVIAVTAAAAGARTRSPTR
ncbi:MAG TPA: hypothetical protein VMI75_34480 [Polyangiaceae bacterium]|nr:hypothetical protein [Polyangiaceae bacterium]